MLYYWKKYKFFKNQIKGKNSFLNFKKLKNAIIQILKDFRLYQLSNCTILLSPAAASFDQFKNFEERGLKFKKLSKKYARKFI